LPLLPKIEYDQFDADYESEDSSDWGWAEAKAPIRFEQTEFSLKQVATRMRQPHFCKFNKWKKVWVAGFLEKKHRSINPVQKCLNQLGDGPLHGVMAVTGCLEAFDTWLRLDNFENSECLRQQCVEMIVKILACEVQEARKKGRRGNT
jgi:hypothetical protein